jgi:MscS family membrane protein
MEGCEVMSMSGKHTIRLVLALMSVLLIAVGVKAADKSAFDLAVKGPQQAEATYDDLLGRNTPRGTVLGFIRAMQSDDKRAVDYLDTWQTGKSAQQLALQLNYILNLAVSSSVGTMSAKPEGNPQVNVPANRQIVCIIKTQRGEYKILLERDQKGNKPPIWLFSSETLKSVPQIYEETDVPWMKQHLPAYLSETQLAGKLLISWVLPFVVLILAFLFGWLFTTLFFALLLKPLRRQLDETLLQKIGQLRKSLLLLIAAAAIYVISLGTFSLLERLFWTFLASMMAIIGLMWLAIHMIEIGADIIERRRPKATNAVIRLSATMLEALAIVLGLVVIFYYFAEINLTAVVAGLGVGGIAVAFAAKNTIENFFGGVFLVWDKPIRLGDYCKAGEYEGTVEHIGLRSTQIRTLNHTVVFIPNGQLASIGIENFTLRNRFLFQHTLNLRYETTGDQLRYILTQLRELLYQHPRLDSVTARVRFVGFGQSSLDVEIFAYILETAQELFLAVQEDLLLRIMDLVESGGSGLSFPSQTLYIKKDGGLDEKKGREAAETVQRWKNQGELPFPDHAPSRISQLDNTLEYPPKGSVLINK